MYSCVDVPIERRFTRHLIRRALSRAEPSAGMRMPMSSAMIEITTSNSMSVKPRPTPAHPPDRIARLNSSVTMRYASSPRQTSTANLGFARSTPRRGHSRPQAYWEVAPAVCIRPGFPARFIARFHVSGVQKTSETARTPNSRPGDTLRVCAPKPSLQHWEHPCFLSQEAAKPPPAPPRRKGPP